MGSFPWHLELQITLDLKQLQLFAFCLSNRILPKSYHKQIPMIHMFCLNYNSVIHFQYLLVNFDIFMNKLRYPNLLVIIQNLLNESVNIDTYWGFSNYRYLLVSIDTYWKSKFTLTYILDHNRVQFTLFHLITTFVSLKVCRGDNSLNCTRQSPM